MNHENFHRILRGFWESAVLIAAVELEIFDYLDKGDSSAEEMAHKLNLDQRGLRILLNALCSLGFLTQKKGRYSLTKFTRNHLTRESRAPLFGFVKHNKDLWDAWGDLPHVVKKGFPRKGFATLGYKTGKESLRNFALAMHHGGSAAADEIAKAFDYGTVKSIIDVGGCTGRYALALKKKLGAKRAVVLDLPEMVKEARNIIRHHDPSELRELEFISGDFFEFEAYGDFDLAILSNIVHSLSFEDGVALFKRVKNWLSQGGKMLVHDMTVTDSGTKPERSALFAVNMLVNTKAGTVYTESEMIDMARKSGFRKIKKKRTSSGNLLLLCS